MKAKKRRRSFLSDLYGTAVGKKYAMAITGILMLGFVFMHMLGNLKMYLGPTEFIHYAEFLRELLVPLLPLVGAVATVLLGRRLGRSAHMPAIAGIGAALGAAYGGSLAVTTTSGPGIALKSETIGLAVAMELRAYREKPGPRSKRSALELWDYLAARGPGHANGGGRQRPARHGGQCLGMAGRCRERDPLNRRWLVVV